MNDQTHSSGNFFQELQRRRVPRVAAVYLGTGFVILEAADMIFPRLGLPDWLVSAVLGLLAIGFPVALLLSWFFEITPDGVARAAYSTDPQATTHKPFTSNIIIAVLAVVIVILVLFPGFRPSLDSSEQVNPKSIAVLPFTSFSSDEDAVYFADGMTDVILTQLAKVGDLKVISRTSTIQYRNTDKPIPVIAAELGVANILEGSVQRVGDQVRIVGQLINAVTDEHLWAETFDRDYADVFALQSEVARSIASALKASLTPEEENYLNTPPTRNQAAWEAYMRGKIEGNNLDGDLDSALVHFREAIDLDPDFLLAYASLVRQLSFRYFSGNDPRATALTEARDFLERMRAIDPQSPDYHLASGYYHYYSNREFEKALEQFELARRLQPNNADLFHALGLVNRRTGDWEAAIQNMEAAVELDPRDLNKVGNLVETCYFYRDWSKTRKYFGRVTDIIGSHPRVVQNRYFLTISSTGNIRLADSILEDLISEFGRERMLDPLEMQAYLAERYGECRELVRSNPERDRQTRLEELSRYHRLEGHLDSAAYYSSILIDEIRADQDMDPDYWGTQLTLARAMAVQGDTSAAIRILRELSKNPELLDDFVVNSQILDGLTDVYLISGRYGDALMTLDEVLGKPSEVSLGLLLVEPQYAPLRKMPGYQDLLNRYDHQLDKTIIF